MKFLFTMEYVGTELWKKRKDIVRRYFEVEKDPFVRRDDNISVADFRVMLDVLKLKGEEI